MRKCSDFTHFCLLARAFRTRCSSSTCSSSTCSNAISLPRARFAAAASHCFRRRERVCGCLGVSTIKRIKIKKRQHCWAKYSTIFFNQQNSTIFFNQQKAPANLFERDNFSMRQHAERTRRTGQWQWHFCALCWLCRS